ncbi:MAG: protein kinase [Myxococcota bacterium]|nr:protein kinase [Myxococcota bacterium]
MSYEAGCHAASDQRAPVTRVQPGDVLEARHRYQILQHLGRGGFGSVYVARCLDPGPESPPEQVAVKVLGTSSDPRTASALKRELAALLAIDDPRIPTVYDWSLGDAEAFVVMQYFPAGSLADAWPFLSRGDESRVWRLITDLLGALSAAHRAGILHLDLKPSNVLLDGDGGFVLSDFGVSQAARMSKGLLHQGNVALGLGTHGYRAPEQANLSIHDFDLRTDLWGVGATAWAMYTGIDLNKRQEVLRRAEDGYIFGLPSLSDIALACPPQLEEVVMSLLFLDPDRRPGGAPEVLAQVRAIAGGFGLDSQTLAAARRECADPGEIQQVIDGIFDPLWASICRSPGFDRYFAKYEHGEVLASGVQGGFRTFLLLSGKVEIARPDGRILDCEEREGSMLCAISTLTGASRELTLRARGTVWTSVFNEAELEQLITCNSSVAVRMLRNLASRLASGPPRNGPAEERDH